MEKTADQRRERIRAELDGLAGKHDWAGTYYEGDGLGENVSLVLSPKAGYVFEWHGCLGVYDRNYGDVAALNGKLRLSFTFDNKHEGFRGIADEFIPVSWGRRKYLIPANDIVGFCNEVNAGAEPREEMHGRYLLRAGDDKIKVTGQPKLPPQYKPYLLDQPVQATIVAIKSSTTRPSVSDWYFQDTVVVLDAGKADRLLPDMELYVVKPEGLVEWVRITKVEEHAAEAVMTQTSEKPPGPRIGWKLSTLPSWRRGLPLLEFPSDTQPADQRKPTDKKGAAKERQSGKPRR